MVKHPIVRLIEESSCPRCNALAHVRAVKSWKGSDTITVVLSCSKCKFRAVQGFTSEAELMFRKRKRELGEALEAAQTPAQRGRIIHEMSRLKEARRMHNLEL